MELVYGPLPGLHLAPVLLPRSWSAVATYSASSDDCLVSPPWHVLCSLDLRGRAIHDSRGFAFPWWRMNIHSLQGESSWVDATITETITWGYPEVVLDKLPIGFLPMGD